MWFFHRLPNGKLLHNFRTLVAASILKSKFSLFIIGIFVGALTSYLFIFNYINVHAVKDAPSSGKYETFTLIHDGISRSYDVYAPQNLKPNSPVFFVFHGSFGTSEVMRIATGYDFEYLAQEKGFLVVYPQGYEKFWNDCRASADYEANLKNIDDVGFFTKMIDVLEKDFSIDTAKVVATGISNGGQMMYRLAYEAPEKALLLAPLVSTIPIKSNNGCKSSEDPVNIMIFNGTADQIAPYEGGLVSLFGNDSRGVVQSSDETYEYWKSLDNSNEEEVLNLAELDGDPNSSVIKKISKGEKVVALYTLVNGGHIYASPNVEYSLYFNGNVRDINTSQEIYSVFESLTR